MHLLRVGSWVCGRGSRRFAGGFAGGVRVGLRVGLRAGFAWVCGRVRDSLRVQSDTIGHAGYFISATCKTTLLRVHSVHSAKEGEHLVHNDTWPPQPHACEHNGTGRDLGYSLLLLEVGLKEDDFVVFHQALLQGRQFVHHDYIERPAVHSQVLELEVQNLVCDVNFHLHASASASGQDSAHHSVVLTVIAQAVYELTFIPQALHDNTEQRGHIITGHIPFFPGAFDTKKIAVFKHLQNCCNLVVVTLGFVAYQDHHRTRHNISWAQARSNGLQTTFFEER